MGFLTIILFFIYCYGLGHSLSRQWKDFNLEVFIMRIGIGLAALPVFGLFLNLIRIPLDWKIFFVCSLIVPIFDLFKNLEKIKSQLKFKKIKPSFHILLLFIIFISCLAIYCGGPFQYSWLEDDDSWFHAAGIKYIAVEKNVNVPKGTFQYIDPYPPGYDLLIGILHQTSPSIYWTLKFFNGLIICLGILFFYYFVKEFTGDRNKALLATCFLAMIPCYLSHFIWAHSLAVSLFFPALYCALKTKDDKFFILPATIIISAVSLVQPTQFIKFVCFFLVFFLASFYWKSLKKSFMIQTLFYAIILSFVLWGAPTIIKGMKGQSVLTVQNKKEPTKLKGYEFNEKNKIFKIISSQFNPKGGSATRAYTFKDYFFVEERNMINNPVGVGLVLSILSILGAGVVLTRINGLHDQKKFYYGTLLGWSIFTFLGLNSMTFHLPVGLFAFRFWMLFAIPVVLLATEATFFIRERIRNKRLFIAVIVGMVFYTSGYKKILINTAYWPRGIVWPYFEELQGYGYLRVNLKPNTKVFTFQDNFLVIGVDMFSDFWREEYRQKFNHAFDWDVNKLYNVLKDNNYEFLVIGLRERDYYGLERFNEKLNLLNKSKYFELIYNKRYAAWVFRLI